MRWLSRHLRRLADRIDAMALSGDVRAVRLASIEGELLVYWSEPTPLPPGSRAPRSTNPKWDIYPLAKWRGVCPVDPATDMIYLSLTVDGEVVRYRFPRYSLIQLIVASLGYCFRPKFQSDRSSSKPSFDVSSPNRLEGQ